MIKKESLIPSYSRYRKILKFHRPGNLILRAMQYEALDSCDTSGKLLDVGGGLKCDYRDLLSCKVYESLNIDAGIQPTWVVDVGAAFPVEDNSYDTVLAMNTFEHVFDATFLLTEMTRSLKKKGLFVATTPFIYMIHAHPNDYFRPTKSWWEEKLSEYGFEEIEVQPLTWGPKSSAHCAVGVNGLGKRLKLRLAFYSDIIYSLLRSHNPTKLNETLSLFPAGYFVTAVKR